MGETGEIVLATFDISNLQTYLLLCLYVLAISGMKICYTIAESYFKFIKFIPESNFLLLVGFCIGAILSELELTLDVLSIQYERFFYVLLPPIVLEAAFSIYHKTFAANFIGVLLFAFVATILNFALVGILLTVINQYDGIYNSSPGSINSTTIWIFSALISAVDPVAVLAIFQEIHVDNNLYYLVFGESLLNDGVSVVLYDVMNQLSKYTSIDVYVILRAVAAFVCVCIGGGLIGVVFSVIACIITRYTFKSPLSEPIIVIFSGYLAYLLASAIGWSGIMSMITYGVIQAAYGYQNITPKSLILIKRLTKILANLTESIIFLNLGVSVILHTANIMKYFEFILWSLFLVLYARFVVTLFIAFIINRYELNMRNIRWNEIFIISYGGLRGGIAFCLAYLTKINIIESTTLFIVLFTIIVMGFTMKPLVKMLSIQIEQTSELSLFNQVNDNILEHLLAAIEGIVGMKGRNALNEIFGRIEMKYIRPLLQRDPMGREEKIMKTYEKLNLTLHMATTAQAGTHVSDYYMNKLKPHIRNYIIQDRNSRTDLSSNAGSVTNLTQLEDMMKVTSSNIELSQQENSISQIRLFERHSNDLEYDSTKLVRRLSAMFQKKNKLLNLSKPRKVTPTKQSLGKLIEIDTDILTMDSKKNSK